MESHEINNVANNIALNAVLRSCISTTNEGTYKSLIDC